MKQKCESICKVVLTKKKEKKTERKKENVGRLFLSCPLLLEVLSFSRLSRAVRSDTRRLT